jgi:hypothetical protein
VSELLREFLNNNVIMFWGAASQRDVEMLKYYRITIHGARDLKREIPNQTFNYPACLFLLANVYIDTNISKNDLDIAAIKREGWVNVPLRFEQVKYAARDAHLGFEIARKCFQLDG